MLIIRFISLHICLMLIDELLKCTGFTALTIWLYEKSGFIIGQSGESVKSKNYFQYNEKTVEKLELV
jgi:hypothetical protein